MSKSPASILRLDEGFVGLHSSGKLTRIQRGLSAVPAHDRDGIGIHQYHAHGQTEKALPQSPTRMLTLPLASFIDENI